MMQCVMTTMMLLLLMRMMCLALFQCYERKGRPNQRSFLALTYPSILVIVLSM